METAQTADYALRVLSELESGNGRTVTQLARDLEINRAVVQRIVATLHARSLLLRGQDGRYLLGPGLIALAADIPHDLARIARLSVMDVARSAQEMIVLAAPDGDESVVVARHSGDHSPLRVEYSVGFRHPLSQGASGLAMLAYMDPATGQRLMPHGAARLHEVVAQGYAFTKGEIRDYMAGVAVPVLDDEGRVIGSLAAIMPDVRATDRVKEVVPMLTAAARGLSDAVASDRSKRPAAGADR